VKGDHLLLLLLLVLLISWPLLLVGGEGGDELFDADQELRLDAVWDSGTPLWPDVPDYVLCGNVVSPPPGDVLCSVAHNITRDPTETCTAALQARFTLATLLDVVSPTTLGQLVPEQLLQSFSLPRPHKLQCVQVIACQHCSQPRREGQHKDKHLLPDLIL
jgi:hypothetical protein